MATTHMRVQIIYNDFPRPAASANLRPLSKINVPVSGLAATATPERNTIHPHNVDSIPSSSPPQPPSTTIRSASIPPGSQDTVESEDPLPPPLFDMITGIKCSLRTQFGTGVPHTVQRFAELVLYPKKHYRFLPSYLNALDRVVAVSSSANIFPLAPIEAVPSTSVIGGGIVAAPMHSFGHDDSLGGALLTPIPWLREHQAQVASAQSPKTNGVEPVEHHAEDGTISQASMELCLREEGAITQGELLRQEQEASAPPMPVGSAASPVQATSAVTSHEVDNTDREIEIEIQEGDRQSRASGSERIGMADTGPQGHALGVGQVLNMEAAVGRLTHAGSPDRQINSHQGVPLDEDRARGGELSTLDADGDTIITDVDGRSGDDLGRGEALIDAASSAVESRIESFGEDAMDTTPS